MRDTLTNHIPTPSGRAARVLVAEDDDAMRAFLVRTLEGTGYDVTEVRTGTELSTYLANALQNRENQDHVEMVDMIVSDILLPGKTAIDILMAFRDAIENTPVILITALDDDITRETAIRLGATAVFDKPFNIDEFKTFLLGSLPPWLKHIQ